MGVSFVAEDLSNISVTGATLEERDITDIGGPEPVSFILTGQNPEQIDIGGGGGYAVYQETMNLSIGATKAVGKLDLVPEIYGTHIGSYGSDIDLKKLSLDDSPIVTDTYTNYADGTFIQETQVMHWQEGDQHCHAVKIKPASNQFLVERDFEVENEREQSTKKMYLGFDDAMMIDRGAEPIYQVGLWKGPENLRNT